MTKEVPGIPGTLSSLLLRGGQCVFAAASATVMVTRPEFTTYTAFCYLVAAMSLQFLWSSGLAALDAYALLIKKSLRNPVIMSLFVVGDWVTSTLSLAAACSTAGVTVLFDKDLPYCSRLHCHGYQISVALAFISWMLIGLSSLITFWLLASG